MKPNVAGSKMSLRIVINFLVYDCPAFKVFCNLREGGNKPPLQT